MKINYASALICLTCFRPLMSIWMSFLLWAAHFFFLRDLPCPLSFLGTFSDHALEPKLQYFRISSLLIFNKYLSLFTPQNEEFFASNSEAKRAAPPYSSDKAVTFRPGEDEFKPWQWQPRSRPSSGSCSGMALRWPSWVFVIPIKEPIP